MTSKSINPATGQTVKIVETWNETQLEQALAEVAAATPAWAALDFATRGAALRRVAAVLRKRTDELARIISWKWAS
jgi:acyl-CoA reductase-like NAD-dependent aldehyde dehydrogenase